MEDATQPDTQASAQSIAAGDEAVAFEVDLVRGDWMDEISRYFVRKYWPMPVFLLILLETLSVLYTEDFSNVDLADFLFWPPLLASGLVLYFHFAGRMTGARAYDTTPIYQKPMSVVLTAKRVVVRGPGLEGSLDLTLLYGVRETTTSFIVRLNSMYFLLWPKSGFKSREDMLRARQFLRDGLSGKAKIQLRDD